MLVKVPSYKTESGDAVVNISQSSVAGFFLPRTQGTYTDSLQLFISTSFVEYGDDRLGSITFKIQAYFSL